MLLEGLGKPFQHAIGLGPLLGVTLTAPARGPVKNTYVAINGSHPISAGFDGANRIIGGTHLLAVEAAARVANGRPGFGMLLDGSSEARSKLESMLFYDVNNGVARRAWARNSEAMTAIKRELLRSPELRVTLAQLANDSLIDRVAAQHF